MKEEKIKEDILNTRVRLEELYQRLDNINKESCAKNGHDFKVIYTSFMANNSDAYGVGNSDKPFKVTYECSICGMRKDVYQKHKEAIFERNIYAHTNYLGDNLCKTGLTLEETLLEEIKSLTEHLTSLNNLKYNNNDEINNKKRVIARVKSR